MHTHTHAPAQAHKYVHLYKHTNMNPCKRKGGKDLKTLLDSLKQKHNNMSPTLVTLGKAGTQTPTGISRESPGHCQELQPSPTAIVLPLPFLP